MIRVKVFVPSWCDSRMLDERGWVEVAEGSTLADVIRMIKMSKFIAKVFQASVNGEAVPLTTPLQNGDVIGFFSLMTGG